MADSDTKEFVDDHRVYFKVKKICFPILAAVSSLLAVVCIVLAVLYSEAVHDDTAAVVQKPGKKYKICNEDRCFDLGKGIVQNMNQSVDPCQDFYTYACGGWQKRHQLKKGVVNSRKDSFSILNEKNLQIVKQALETSSRNYSRNVAVLKTARFYKSCLNTSAIASKGFLPLMTLIAKYGGWSVFGNYDPKYSTAERIGRATAELGVPSLFGAIPETDKYNSSNKILVAIPAMLTYDKAMYFNSSNKIIVEQQAYELAIFFGGVRTYTKLMAIYEFETKLAKISSGKTPLAEFDEFVEKSIRDKTPMKDYRMTINDFCDKSGFSCLLFKRTLEITYGQSFSGNEKMLVTNVAYFKRLYTLYKQTNASVIADYVMWRVFYGYLSTGALSSDITSMITGRNSSTLPRWKTCINLMEKAFDMPLGLLYVNAHFEEKSKQTVEKMTDDIRDSFIDKLSIQTWMDSKTKEKAKEKALAMKVSIGYPDYITNPEKLEERYKSLNVIDDFFTNMVSINRFVWKKKLNSYGKPVDKEEWPASPVKVNGVYIPLENRIVYYAGILQAPFYNPDYPRYMQHGAIGMVIGHEITHGFDASGRKFDKYGNLHNWWSNSADENFNKKSSCLVKQYNKYKVFDKKINGTLTLNENIADNGGIKLAYNAYQRWAASNGTEKILPGLRLNPDQLFFVGFAQGWCSVYTKMAAYQQLRTDVHSIGKYRVIGSLSNFDKFSQAFQCPKGSRMNPTSKCAVW